MKKLAVFDVDGTLFRSSLLIELVEALIEEGLFPSRARQEYVRFQKRWFDRRGPYEDYLAKVVMVFEKYLRGVSYDKFAELAEKLVAFQGSRVYTLTRDLISQLKKKGYFLLAISNSPKTILDQFCRSLGFNKVYGRLYELGPQSRFTGKILDEHLIANKASILKRAVEKENLTLKDSIGVGDTEGDIPFLELTERPIAFNPNKKLYRYAKANNWPIVVERKDVVYFLD